MYGMVSSNLLNTHRQPVSIGYDLPPYIWTPLALTFNATHVTVYVNSDTWSSSISLDSIAVYRVNLTVGNSTCKASNNKELNISTSVS